MEVLRDDMLVVGYGDTQDEANKNHNENLLRLLKRAREINLKFNKKKLNLRRGEVLAALVGSCTASARADNKECKIRVVKPAR